MKKNNRRISDLFYNNRFLLVFSIVAAVAIWLVVAVEFGEDIEYTVKGVKVTLSENHGGLSAFGDTDFTVDVTIRGKKYIVESDETAESIIVNANTGHVNSVGEKTIDLEVSSSEARPLYEFVDLSQETIEVNFDYPKEKEFKIETDITFENSPVADGYHMADFIVSNAYTVEVSGPETEVNKIEKVVARATLEGNLRQSETFTAELVAVTKDGSTLEFVTLNIKSVQVTAPVYKIMTLPLTCDFSNIPMEYLEKLPDYSISPATVKVGIPDDQAQGKENVVLSTKIDFSSLQTGQNTFTISATSDEITGGILLDEIENFVVTVDVKDMSTKSIEPPSEITPSNVPDNLEVTLSQLNFTEVIVIGPQEELDTLTADDLIFTADFSGLDDNSSDVVTVPVKISGDKCWAFGEYTATFTIS